MNPAEITLASRIEAVRLNRDVTDKYVDQLGYSAARFSKWLGREPTLADLTTDVVNAYLRALRKDGKLVAHSIRSQRRNLLVLWHDALKEGLLTEATARVLKVKCPRPMPDSWTDDEVRKMLAAVDEKFGGVFKRSRVPRRYFWRSMILVAWDTGLRLGDLIELRTANVLGRDEFQVVQSKTGMPVFCRLKPETVKAIGKTFPPYRQRIFGDGLCRDQMLKQLRAIVKAAGVGSGSFHKIRRSSATAVELAVPGSAMQFLGHLTPDLAYRHYVDRSRVQQAKPTPPALFDDTYLCQAVEEEPVLCQLAEEEADS